jgi:hypothetical protein
MWLQYDPVIGNLGYKQLIFEALTDPMSSLMLRTETEPKQNWDRTETQLRQNRDRTKTKPTQPRQNRDRTNNEIENIFVNRNINIYKIHYVKYFINELMKLMKLCANK